MPDAPQESADLKTQGANPQGPPFFVSNLGNPEQQAAPTFDVKLPRLPRPGSGSLLEILVHENPVLSPELRLAKDPGQRVAATTMDHGIRGEVQFDPGQLESEAVVRVFPGGHGLIESVDLKMQGATDTQSPSAGVGQERWKRDPLDTVVLGFAHRLG